MLAVSCPKYLETQSEFLDKGGRSAASVSKCEECPEENYMSTTNGEVRREVKGIPKNIIEYEVKTSDNQENVSDDDSFINNEELRSLRSGEAKEEVNTDFAHNFLTF